MIDRSIYICKHGRKSDVCMQSCSIRLICSSSTITRQIFFFFQKWTIESRLRHFIPFKKRYTLVLKSTHLKVCFLDWFAVGLTLLWIKALWCICYLGPCVYSSILFEYIKLYSSVQPIAFQSTAIRCHSRPMHFLFHSFNFNSI